jgi:tetratricopeptide (TPR) repeat protein
VRAGRPLAGFLPVVILLLAGCAAALKTPPDLLELAGGGRPASPADVDRLLDRAWTAFAKRTVPAARRAAQDFLEAAAADPRRTEGLMGAVEVKAWLVDHEEEAELRKRDAVSAVQAAQWCGRIDPEDARCTYWLGAAMGIQARERRSTGLDALPRIEEAFQSAAERLADYKEGAPHRALALFYVRAPGWPKGPGDPDLGLEHARKAVEISPDYAPNQLALAESLRAVQDRKASRQAYRRALEMARAAAAAGAADAADWECSALKGLGKSCPGG